MMRRSDERKADRRGPGCFAALPSKLLATVFVVMVAVHVVAPDPFSARALEVLRLLLRLAHS